MLGSVWVRGPALLLRLNTKGAVPPSPPVSLFTLTAHPYGPRADHGDDSVVTDSSQCTRPPHSGLKPSASAFGDGARFGRDPLVGGVLFSYRGNK